MGSYSIPINLQLPESPRIRANNEVSAAIVGEFQIIYNALRNLITNIETINPPGSGTVTSITTSGGIIGGPITTTGNISIDPALLALINDAVQPGDNISVLVNDAGYIVEAPSDGTIYGRQNGAWVPAGGGGGGGILPVVTGEVPPVFVYLDDGSLVYTTVED